MKSIQVWAATTVLAFVMAASGQSIAATCNQTCSATFNQCTSAGGAQSSCMKTWMQCRNQCSGVSAKPAPQASRVAATVTVAKPVRTAKR
jgi:hypothetical protein